MARHDDVSWNRARLLDYPIIQLPITRWLDYFLARDPQLEKFGFAIDRAQSFIDEALHALSS
jgi:hypothetical protein